MGELLSAEERVGEGFSVVEPSFVKLSAADLVLAVDDSSVESAREVSSAADECSADSSVVECSILWTISPGVTSFELSLVEAAAPELLSAVFSLLRLSGKESPASELSEELLISASAT